MRKTLTNLLSGRSVAALVLAGVAAGSVLLQAGTAGPSAAADRSAAAHPLPQRSNSEQPGTPAAPKPTASHNQAASGAGGAVAAAPTPDGRGFWVAWAGGTVTTAGDAHWYGDLSQVRLNRPIVGIAASPTGAGYWLLGADGGVFTFGDARYHGSTGNVRLNRPALQMASTPNGAGYDFVASDGGIFTFGNAAFHGSTGAQRLNRPIVGMAMTPDGRGYWLVASDGGIFTFGDARFYGSTGSLRLRLPMVGIARTANGGGYWLVAADGGVFTFGNAVFHGSGAGSTGGSPAVGIVSTHDGGGYWIVLADGAVLSRGDAAPVATATRIAPNSDTSYTFEVTNSAGVPARWNPCRPIHYAVVWAGAPGGWQNDVSYDIGQLSAATGVPFVNDGAYGSSSQVPSSTKVTISWVSSLSGGDQVGLTTYWYYLTSGYAPQLISAKVQLLSSLAGGSGYAGEQPVLLHELGHVMGLGHTNNPAEVMDPVDQGHTTLQAGDLNGLWHLGSAQGCTGFYQ